MIYQLVHDYLDIIGLSGAASATIY